MKKVRGHHLLYGAAALMVLGFCIHVAVDWHQYLRSAGSFPFWAWILSDAVLWLIPAALALIAGLVAKKKLLDKEKRK